MAGNKRTTADVKSADCENKKLKMVERSSEFSKEHEESASDKPLPIQAQDEFEKAKQGK